MDKGVGAVVHLPTIASVGLLVVVTLVLIVPIINVPFGRSVVVIIEVSCHGYNLNDDNDSNDAADNPISGIGWIEIEGPANIIAIQIYQVFVQTLGRGRGLKN